MNDDTENNVSPARQAVDYAMAGDATNFKDTIDQMLYTKVADAISVKKLDIASSMFGDQTIGDVADDEIGDEDEYDEYQFGQDEEDTEAEEESDEEL